MTIKPFLKWVGGKSKLLKHIVPKFPKQINNYHEPFLGGGSILLTLLQEQKTGNIKIKGSIYAYDLNKQLIQVYRDIQSNKDELIGIIEKYKNIYDSCPNVEKGMANRKPENENEALKSKESYYYWLRKKFNEIKDLCVENSALFIVLNKTCFRGVYREGPNGFNVPFGHYKHTPGMINNVEINRLSELIKDVIFIDSNYMESLKNIYQGDFVYLDPPYAPENNTSFVGYTKKGFSLIEHNKLFNKIKELDNKKIKFVMNNANVELVRKNFEKYKIDEIVARRAINSKNPESTAREVIIYN